MKTINQSNKHQIYKLYIFKYSWNIIFNKIFTYFYKIRIRILIMNKLLIMYNIHIFYSIFFIFYFIYCRLYIFFNRNFFQWINIFIIYINIMYIFNFLESFFYKIVLQQFIIHIIHIWVE